MKVRIIVDAGEPFPELAEDIAAGRMRRAELTAVTALPGGMKSGSTSVAFVGRTEDGQTVLMETSLRVFQSAAAAFTGRHGDESGGAMFAVGSDGAMLGWSKAPPT